MTTRFAPALSGKLYDILLQTWASPVFGDSYPPVENLSHESTATLISAVYQTSVATLEWVLARGMPELLPIQRSELVGQIAAKSVAFCGAIGGGDLDDLERLRAASVCIALVYWCDQCMDRGDSAMRAAVRLLTDHRPTRGPIDDPLIQSRVTALGWFVHEVATLCRPEDALWVLRTLLEDTLRNEVQMLSLTDAYLARNDAAFWDDHADEIAQRSIDGVGFIAVVSMIYAIYRQRDPSLPMLTEALHEPRIMRALYGAGSSAIRMFDDIGDRTIDTGDRPEWGRFTLNIVNQYNPRWMRAFLDYAGIDDPARREQIERSLASGDYQAIIATFIAFNREAFGQIEPELAATYQVFLTLARRVIEAGFVHMKGDEWLAEMTIDH